MIEYVFWVMVMILTTSIFIYSTFLFGTLIGWWVFGYRELFDGLTFYLFYKPEKFVDDDIGDVFMKIHWIVVVVLVVGVVVITI